MTLIDFAKIAENQFNYCLELMCGEKNTEYSRNQDKLHNFKAGARLDNTTPERTLFGYWKKQLTSVLDIIDDIDKGEIPGGTILHEKITDNINYLVLLKALIIERMQNEKKKANNISSNKE